MTLFSAVLLLVYVLLGAAPQIDAHLGQTAKLTIAAVNQLAGAPGTAVQLPITRRGTKHAALDSGALQLLGCGDRIALGVAAREAFLIEKPAPARSTAVRDTWESLPRGATLKLFGLKALRHGVHSCAHIPAALHLITTMVHDRDWFALYRHKDETSGVVTCLKVPASSELVTRGVVSPNGPCLDPTESMPCLRYAYLDDLHLVLYLPGVQKLAVKALASKRQNMASLPVVTVLASPARDPVLCNAVVTAVDSLLHLDAGAKETMKTELKAEFRHRCEVQTAAHVVASQGLRVLREAYVRREAMRGHRAQEQELRHMCDGLSDMDSEFDAANLVALGDDDGDDDGDGDGGVQDDACLSCASDSDDDDGSDRVSGPSWST